jgi:hypothetical protein
MNRFDLPILIYLPKKFPYQQPEIFLERTSKEIGVNLNNRNVDPNTFKIMTKFLANWNNYSTIEDILGEIKCSFNENFPINEMRNKNLEQQQTYINYNSHQNVPGYFNKNQQPVYNTQNFQNNNQSHSNNSVNSFPQFPQTKNQQIATDNFPNIQNAQNSIKYILIEDIKKLVGPKIYLETNNLLQESQELIKFKNEFSSNINKYQQYISNKDNLINYLEDLIKKLNLEYESLSIMVKNMEKNVITNENFLYYIEKSNENILHFISIEAFYEDIISIAKKGFLRQILNFSETVKFIRLASRENFKMRSIREILITKI